MFICNWIKKDESRGQTMSQEIMAKMTKLAAFFFEEENLFRHCLCSESGHSRPDVELLKVEHTLAPPTLHCAAVRLFNFWLRFLVCQYNALTQLAYPQAHHQVISAALSWPPPLHSQWETKCRT
jgi:hypothetical protein